MWYIKAVNAMKQNYYIFVMHWLYSGVTVELGRGEGDRIFLGLVSLVVVISYTQPPPQYSRMEIKTMDVCAVFSEV